MTIVAAQANNTDTLGGQFSMQVEDCDCEVTFSPAVQIDVYMEAGQTIMRNFTATVGNVTCGQSVNCRMMLFDSSFTQIDSYQFSFVKP